MLWTVGDDALLIGSNGLSMVYRRISFGSFSSLNAVEAILSIKVTSLILPFALPLIGDEALLVGKGALMGNNSF